MRILENLHPFGGVVGDDDGGIRTETCAEDGVLFEHGETFFPDNEAHAAGPFVEENLVGDDCPRMWNCEAGGQSDGGGDEREFAPVFVHHENDEHGGAEADHAADAFGEGDAESGGEETDPGKGCRR